MRQRHIVSIVLAVEVIGACTPDPGGGNTEPVTEPVKERLPSLIRYYGDRPLLEAPDTVLAGEPFTISVRTFGGGCIAQGDTDVEVRGRVVEVRPYDVFTTRLPPNYGCASYLSYYAHSVEVRLTEPGTATIRAIGRSAAEEGRPTTIERSVVVR